MSEEPKPRNKKLYDTPKLTTYGDIREITRNVDTQGMGDGAGMVANNKT